MSVPEPFVTSRTFDAPRHLLFDVHTKPEHLSRWLSPAGFETIHAALDFKPGGSYHYGIEGPGGARMWGLQSFVEIVPNERLVLVQSFSDEHRGLTRHPMAPAWPLEMLVTTTFEDAAEGKARLCVSWQPYRSDAAGHAAFDGARAGMAQGFAGTFEKLAAYLLTLTKH